MYSPIVTCHRCHTLWRRAKWIEQCCQNEYMAKYYKNNWTFATFVLTFHKMVFASVMLYVYGLKLFSSFSNDQCKYQLRIAFTSQISLGLIKAPFLSWPAADVKHCKGEQCELWKPTSTITAVERLLSYRDLPTMSRIAMHWEHCRTLWKPTSQRLRSSRDPPTMWHIVKWVRAM